MANPKELPSSENFGTNTFRIRLVDANLERIEESIDPNDLNRPIHAHVSLKAPQIAETVQTPSPTTHRSLYRKLRRVDAYFERIESSIKPSALVDVQSSPTKIIFSADIAPITRKIKKTTYEPTPSENTSPLKPIHERKNPEDKTTLDIPNLSSRETETNIEKRISHLTPTERRAVEILISKIKDGGPILIEDLKKAINKERHNYYAFDSSQMRELIAMLKGLNIGIILGTTKSTE